MTKILRKQFEELLEKYKEGQRRDATYYPASRYRNLEVATVSKILQGNFSYVEAVINRIEKLIKNNHKEKEQHLAKSHMEHDTDLLRDWDMEREILARCLEIAQQRMRRKF